MKRILAITLLVLIVVPLFAATDGTTYDLMTNSTVTVDPFMYGENQTVKIENPFSHAMLAFFWFMAIGGGATVLLLTATALVKAVQNQEEDPNGVQKVIIRLIIRMVTLSILLAVGVAWAIS